jgi:hypothetical protein
MQIQSDFENCADILKVIRVKRMQNNLTCLIMLMMN